MKRLIIFLFLILISVSAFAQLPGLNDIVRSNTLSPTKVANALDGSRSYVASGTNTYTVTTAAAFQPYSGIATYGNGDMWTIAFTNSNTSTTVTLNIDSEGAIAVKDNEGNDLSVGDLKAGGTYTFRYNGSVFRVVGAIPGFTSNIPLTDAATIDLTATKHTLSSSSATRTFTISYTGDDITIEVTLSATSATYTFPSGSLCVSEGVASGNNTIPLSGVSGDKYIICTKKIGSSWYVVAKNFKQ